MPYLSASEVMIHEEALYQAYVPFTFTFMCVYVFLCIQETSQSVSLRSSDGAGFGFDICGDDSGAIAVQSLQSGGPAQQSGLLQPGRSAPAARLGLSTHPHMCFPVFSTVCLSGTNCHKQFSTPILCLFLNPDFVQSGFY